MFTNHNNFQNPSHILIRIKEPCFLNLLFNPFKAEAAIACKNDKLIVEAKVIDPPYTSTMVKENCLRLLNPWIPLCQKCLFL